MTDVPDLSFLKKRIAQLQDEDAPEDLRKGSGGGNSGGMDQRLTRLEEWAKISEERAGRVEGKIDGIVARISSLPSKGELIGYAIATAALLVAVVTGMVSGLGWLETRASRMQPVSAPVLAAPIIIQVPPYAVSKPLPGSHPTR